jgi:hypothetical protein
MKALVILICAFGLICVGWAIHPGVGILVALLAYGAVEGLLSK